MMTVIVFIIILSLLVFVHELGHFWTAKKMGMDVEEFGFGFPPRAWGKKIGNTIYSINWLPIGGFVKIKGEDGTHRNEAGSFASKKPWQRIVVLSAGVIMNFLLAAIILGVGFMFGVPQALDGVDGATVVYPQVQVINVIEGLPAAEAGIKIGDSIKQVNGIDIVRSSELIEVVHNALDTTAMITVQRGEERIEMEVPVVLLEETQRGGIGVGLIETGTISYPWYTAIFKGFEAAVMLTVAIVTGFVALIGKLITGAGVGASVSGPVGIAVMTGQVAQLGWVYLMQFTAMLSLNLAVLNFLPFPALDGGRVIFVIMEKLRGKPVPQKVEGYFHAAGFLLLMLLIIVVTFKDVVRLIQ